MTKKEPSTTDDILQVISELTTMIAARFDQQDARFDKQDARFDKQDARFDKQDARFDQQDISLFKLGEEIKDLKSDMAEVKDKVNRIYGVLDAHMKRLEDIMIDNKVRDHQQERMERWIFQLADKIDLKLKYE